MIYKRFFYKTKVFKVLLIIISLYLPMTLVNAKTVYVSPLGKDSSEGSKSFPFLTIQRGLDSLTAGDSLLVREGGYFIDNALEVKNSGRPNAWITIMAFPGEKVTVNADNFLKSVPEGREGYKLVNENGAFNIKNVHNVRIIGIAIYDGHSAGFLVKNSKNVELLQCKTFYTMGSGIGLWYSDSVKVFYCEVVQANTKENIPKGIQYKVETPHEAISIAGCKVFEVAYNYLHNCVKEGIDVKEFSEHGSIHHNYLHDINRQGLYVDSWFGTLSNVRFYSNIVHNSEWGFGISGEGVNSNMKNIYFYNNLIYDCRGSGIIFSKFGLDEIRDSIYVINNTVFNCGMPGHWAGNVGGIDIRSASIKNVFIANNIVFNNWGFEIAIFDSLSNNNIISEKNIVIENNLISSVRVKQTRVGFWGNHVFPIKKMSNIFGEPSFKSKETRDFNLDKKSLARNKSNKNFPFIYYYRHLGANIEELENLKAEIFLKM